MFLSTLSTVIGYQPDGAFVSNRVSILGYDLDGRQQTSSRSYNTTKTCISMTSGQQRRHQNNQPLCSVPRIHRRLVIGSCRQDFRMSSQGVTSTPFPSIAPSLKAELLTYITSPAGTPTNSIFSSHKSNLPKKINQHASHNHPQHLHQDLQAFIGFRPSHSRYG